MCRTTSRKAVRIKLFPLICIVLFVLFPNTMAYASTPTLTPAPAASPTPGSRSIMDSFEVQLINDGTSGLLGKSMLTAHENGCYYDGILVFMPLRDYVENTQIPCIKRSDDFNYQVIALDPSVSINYSHTVYNQEWEVIMYGETPASDWNELDSGKYLMSIKVFATDGDRYGSTASLFWLIVGDDEGGEEHMSLPSPTVSPASTPASTASVSPAGCAS